MIRKTVSIVRNAWLLAGMTLVTLCVLEGIASLGYLLKTRLGAHSIDQRVAADEYADRSWVDGYYREFHQSLELQWSSYVYWRQRPHRGNYINIAEDGTRLTIDGESTEEESREAIRIFMFGGSTLWGTGARDAFTIPSLVAKELRSRGVISKITNFGETAYVSTQELITLLLRLRQRDLPDLVVFYDGVNDIMSAYQQDIAGLPQNEFNRVREFNLSTPAKLKYRALLVTRDFVEQLSMVALLRDLLGRSTARPENGSVENRFDSAQAVKQHAIDVESLASDVLRTYMANLELIAALSDEYQFRYLFYWQPTIFDKTHLTKFERLQRDKMDRAEHFIHKTYDLLHRTNLADRYGNSFHDLTKIFSKVKGPIYLDWSHPGESGNKIIAKRMANDILNTINTGNRHDDRND
jgi:hypothetical protein